ncbi:MAG: hypothetical protein J6P20_04130, partial [Oscillospiraceae bacterium]|nr:hypothetical protein [Oscillospiraceae bacterium]
MLFSLQLKCFDDLCNVFENLNHIIAGQTGYAVHIGIDLALRLNMCSAVLCDLACQPNCIRYLDLAVAIDLS